ncbi:S49 family peptidase [Methylocella tundrae]|uniref:Peptidase S49 n=1 Tax=Methylocella tundrae TaxID=227605 RepID=A0A4U8YX49_METTU|nr:S49 family peptidase [Methylocella tundrae]WPP05501.1 S49 family peptidase [Methylocella tundrae]VFU07926.1 Peptidase S49 [Methylocella tundrae]
MTELARVAGLLFNRPLLLMPETAIAIASNLADRFGVDPMQPPAEASAFRGRPVTGTLDDGSKANLYRMQDGVAIIPVMGELVNRGSWIGASSGLTSYEGLAEQLRKASADPNVRGILLDVDSPGGEAAGAMETGAIVRQTAAQKPVVAYVSGLAASAGYAISAGANHIVTAPSANLGSIGVVRLHVDRSEAIARAGLKPTLITAGAYKGDHSSFTPLEPEARARIQAGVDDLYDLFVSHVASSRKLPEKAVRATEAGMFMGQRAVDVGLADRVGDFDAAMAYFDDSSPKNVILSGANMTESTTANTAAELAAATSSAASQARTAERARAQAILNAPEAQGRADLANYLAFETDMAPEAASALLAKAPVVASAAAASEQTAARPRLTVPVPDVNPDADAAAGAEAAAGWDKIYADLNRQAAASNRAFVIPG